VLGALPGGDPLAAALAAGETPSPELVASAGGAGSVSPRAALMSAVFLAFAFMALAWMNGPRLGILDESSGVLALRAEEALTAAGFPDPPRHSANGFSTAEMSGYGEGAPSMFYWHRWSPRPLIHSSIHMPRADLLDPPQALPGSATVLLDGSGNLLALHVVPKLGGAPDSTGTVDWPALLKATGVASEALHLSAPARAPSVVADTVLAWEGGGAEYLAAAMAGRLLHFSMEAEWGSTFDFSSFGLAAEGQETGAWIPFLIIVLIPLIVTVSLSWHNIRARRGDLRGAFWLAGLVFVVYQAESLFSLSVGEIGLRAVLEALIEGAPAGHALVHATITWFAYVAIEPYVRRWWPHVLVSWARLVSGRARDPIVGRDVFAAGVFAAAATLMNHVIGLAAVALGFSPRLPSITPFELIALPGTGSALALTAHLAAIGSLTTIVFFTQLFVFRLILRSNRVAVIVTTVLYGLMVGVFFSGAEDVGLPVALIQGMTYSAAFAWVVVRFGLLAALAGSFMRFVLMFLPWTLDFSAWYAARALPGALVVGGLLLLGFFKALGGQSLFRDPLAEPAGSPDSR
jgi:serine/threonine-protein kinase